MEDQKFFLGIDAMLSETLTVKSLNEICSDLEKEVKTNRGKYKNNFKLALEMGEKGEVVVRKFLENLGYTFLSKCEDISHDYKFVKDGKEQIFEIKTDVAHIYEDSEGNLRDTGNMAIEYECRGKKSGIAITGADFFVTYYPQLNEIWLIKVEKLKDLIRKNKDDETVLRKFENAGDEGSNTKLFLIVRDKVKNEFRIANPNK